MKKATTARVLMLVFGLMGAVFLAIGLVFLAKAGMITNAEDAEVFPVLGTAFGVIGAAMLGVTLVIGLVDRKQRLRQEELLRWGTRVTGTVVDIPVDKTLTVNGRHPLRIVAAAVHPATRETVTVRSRQVWETSLSEGDPVDVLFDPMDEKVFDVVLPETEPPLR